MLPLSLTRPDPAALDALVARHLDAEPTYAEVGATAGPLPAGYRHARHSAEVGRGDGAFARAADGLRRWQAHRGSGAIVRPGAPPAEGQSVGVAVRVALAWVTVVNRVVRVTDEPAAFGFAYGSVDHHVMEGEEAFTVRLGEDGAVRFDVVSFTRPRGRALKAAGPLVQPLDDLIVRRYLDAMRAHVAGDG